MASASTSFLGSAALLKPQASTTSQPNVSHRTNLVVKASSSNQQNASSSSISSRRNVMGIAAAAAFVAATGLLSGEQAKADLIEDLLAKSAANKELNDRKRRATVEANLARAYTVEFNTCKFPDNFTGCQDLAKNKNVKFLSDDLKIECEGKDKYKCGSNVFWKWSK